MARRKMIRSARARVRADRGADPEDGRLAYEWRLLTASLGAIAFGLMSRGTYYSPSQDPKDDVSLLSAIGTIVLVGAGLVVIAMSFVIFFATIRG
jgi:hypothetical protein